MFCDVGDTASPERAHNSFPETQPFEVTVTRRENEGFGFVIISSVTRVGSMIGMSGFCHQGVLLVIVVACLQWLICLYSIQPYSCHFIAFDMCYALS